ncbi:MAG: rod shape-determining protein RodA [Chloroflexota bacterium]|nr:rod shape-determining protein RodA [Chloroflexota bacterium]MDE3100755.1 rod shape-determining protein RodA [Chloroflexota bacterium]
MSVRPIAIPVAASPLHDRPTERRLLSFDWILLTSTLLLVAYGVVVGYSTAMEDRASGADVGEQVLRAILYAVIGLSVMTVVALVDHAWLGTFSPFLYVMTLVLLAMVLVIGHSTLGATRWVSIAGFRFQPSEFAKVFMVIVLAKWFADHEARSVLGLAGALALIAVPVALVYRQPDLGTSIVFLGMFFGIALVAGARPWHLTALLAAGAAAVPLLYGHLQAYQQSRLTAFLNPYADPRGAGWNIIQSLIAVGSGSLTGKGLTAGTQSPLGYLPISQSDFVFAGLAEDLGFVGAMILFVLYLVLLLSVLRVAHRSRDAFGAYLAGGVAALLGFQIVVNVGMAISLMPVTGVPLPFISQGGSSLISICLALGALQSICTHQEVTSAVSSSSAAARGS